MSYKTVTIEANADPKKSAENAAKVTDACNQLGRDGFRVIAITPQTFAGHLFGLLITGEKA